jgi:hypothetical protein
VTSPLYTDLRKRRESALRQAPWNGSLGLAISGVRLDVHGLPIGLERTLAKRFQLFVSPSLASPEADLAIRARPAVVEGYLEYDKQQSRLYRLETRMSGERLHVWSYAFAGWFEIDGREGEISICDSDVEPPERSVENFLRVAFAWKASKRGGFLFHSAGLVRHGKAFLFFGPSGSGKTTVTRLSANDLLLNDDCIHITRRDGEFRANGVPFKGRDDCGAENAGEFPIGGIFRLVQSRRVCYEPLSTAHGAAEIVSSIPFVSERREGLERNLAVAEELVRSVPVGRLQFRLAPDFWNVIEEMQRG